MGCTNDTKFNFNQKVNLDKKIEYEGFQVNIEDPNSKEMKSFFLKYELDIIEFPMLMNLLAFDKVIGNAFDANFISKYDEHLHEFQYYVQKLIGIEIENETYPNSGKIWIPFINSIKENWTEICNKNRIIIKTDFIQWKFMKFE